MIKTAVSLTNAGARAHLPTSEFNVYCAHAKLIPARLAGVLNLDIIYRYIMSFEKISGL
jgi:hypothetical protein